jgi:hypothetical protein
MFFATQRRQKAPLKHAAKLITTFTPKSLAAIQREIDEAAAAEKCLPEVLKGLLPVEEQAREKIETHVRGLTERAATLKPIIDLGTKYKQVSLEPLTWVGKDRLPLLVVFSLNEPRFVLRSWRSGELNVGRAQISSPELPESIINCYRPMLREMALGHGWGIGERTFTCSFSGVIPASVKANIAKARGDFGDNIFIIAEAGRWQKVTATREDPLVVGFDGHNLWLIDMFDVTPAEQAMAHYPLGPTNIQA